MKINVIKTIVVFVFLLIISNDGFSQDTRFGGLATNKAINIAGKQRMLTQKMGKIYLYLLNNPNAIKAKKDLKISKIIFEKQLLILEKNTSSALTKSKIKEVKDIWKKYKEFLESVPNKDTAIKIINTNSTILKYTNNLVKAVILESKGNKNFEELYIAEEDSELKKMIDKAGRQRMLSQRLALYYFANKENLKTAKVTEKLKTTFLELENASNDLLISNFNNDRLDEAIGNAIVLWESISIHKERLFVEGYRDEEIYKLSNDLTNAFNKVTGLYEKIKIE